MKVIMVSFFKKLFRSQQPRQRSGYSYSETLDSHDWAHKMEILRTFRGR